MSTATETFTVIAGIVESALQPPARGQATAATLRQFAAWCEPSGCYLEQGDVECAYRLLAEAQADDEPGDVVGRRKTVGEIAALLAPAHDAALPRFAHAMTQVVAALDGSTDPREVTIRTTARREVDEIEAIIRAGRPPLGPSPFRQPALPPTGRKGFGGHID